jgi:hypothetical protein
MIYRPMGTVAAFPLKVQPVGPTGPMIAAAATMSKPAAARTLEPAVARAPELKPNLAVKLTRPAWGRVEPGGPEIWAITVVPPQHRYHTTAQPRTCA